MHNKLLLLIAPLLVTVVLSCGSPATQVTSDVPQLFTLLKGDKTRLTFNNQPELTAEFNVFNYMYFYNGGGLAAGDFNQDGLVDLYFTSNQGANRMYLNEGELKFREITEQAGVAGLPGWTTGASVVDINQDGLLDIYVNQVSGYLMLTGQNQLYVCQGLVDGVPTYKDEAAAYGLDFASLGTQAAFFDYDLDGDLDMYQLNHSLHQNGTFGKRTGKLKEANPLTGDRLMRNDDGKFINVTEAAGIYSSVIGYGLGLATGDLNNDGWPDIYVGNDFHENDYLYLNNQDGTFREVLTEMMQHTSRFSMGVDIADINNDGLREVFSLDMLPEDPQILKSSLGEDGFDVFKFKLGFGYNPQFSRNTLQLNNGDGSFSEIGAFAGVEASDWSWGSLFFDFDHDGLRDLFISNGIPRRMNDIDYINFKTNTDLQFREEYNDIRDSELAFIDKMPEIKLKNKFYRNQGNLRFADLSEGIAGGDISYSSSAVYVDLDNDGDLDVVTNNIDDTPYLYRNEYQKNADSSDKGSAWLKIEVRGSEKNRDGVGSVAIVFAGDERMVYDYFPTRGYQSSVQAPLLISLGDPDLVDSVLFVFPDRRYRVLDLVAVDTTITVAYSASLPKYKIPVLPIAIGTAQTPDRPVFEDITARSGIDFMHVENAFVDFTREPLMPNMASTEGPALAVGDVNGDGREDFYVGSSKRNRSALYLQNPDLTFRLATPEVIVLDSVYEDVDAAFADLDGDGDLDLVVAAGGNEYFANQEPRTQRIYWNDGRGDFTKYVIPELFMTASCVVPGDVNGDGLIDLFFGGRVVPRFYGQIPDSYLLINVGNGKFADATEAWSADLKKAGFVKDGRWADTDADGDLDLIIAAEWAPITIYENQGDRLQKQTVGQLHGWWNTVEAADLDGDGDLDILAGNLGLNNKLKPTEARPLEMYVNDFDGNGQPEQVLTYYVKDRKIPFASHAELIKQLPSLKKKYLFAQEMAGATLEDMFGADNLAQADKFLVNTLASYAFMNNGDGIFTPNLLPDRAQFSALQAFCPLGADAGAGSSWLSGGNFLGSNIEMGWYDASFVSTLHFDGRGGAEAMPLAGLRIGGEVRAIKAIRLGQTSGYLVARSGGALKLLTIQPPGSGGLTVTTD
ncbi:VCBS repeat-containing protein [Neolewinella antarctica]|uniref:ASPIC/UnbV domain-containing protein n=1 Tax=Neolewinella antarctica TaxID=442734 RepID=A0ABX0X992_9BACT|nr:VCBS repeat-containing protein [Neolewinella antarctica]NJC25352.1 hypothetical protein [Neolewinella antarctica]